MTPPQDHGSRTLPGWAIDVLTDGADLSRGRAEVVRQVRRVMLSAHRLGIDWPTVHALLSDTAHRRLAHQLAHGHKGRRIAPASVRPSSATSDGTRAPSSRPVRRGTGRQPSATCTRCATRSTTTTGSPASTAP